MQKDDACYGFWVDQGRQQIDDQNSGRDAVDPSTSIHLFPSGDAGEVRVDDGETPSLGRHADGGMLGEGLTHPGILAILGTNDDYQIVPGGIVTVEQVGDQPHEAETAGQNHELILAAQLLEEVLLVLQGQRELHGLGSTVGSHAGHGCLIRRSGAVGYAQQAGAREGQRVIVAPQPQTRITCFILLPGLRKWREGRERGKMCIESVVNKPGCLTLSSAGCLDRGTQGS
jgi:hypothetical protein